LAGHNNWRERRQPGGPFLPTKLEGSDRQVTAWGGSIQKMELARSN